MSGREVDGQLELTISTEKDSYYVDEPIYLVARLSNKGPSALPVPPPRIEPSGIPSNIGLSVKASEGITLQPVSREVAGGIELTGQRSELTTLGPGKSWVVVVDVLAAYGRGTDRGNMIFRRGRLERDEYTIEAFYKASLEQTGIIRSKPLKLRIKRAPPWEWTARARILKAHKLYRSDSSDSMRQKAIKLYQKTIKKHPKSRYLADAYRMLVEVARDRDVDSLKWKVYETQTKFKDPVFLYDLAMHLEETAYMDRDRLIGLLRALAWRVPGSTFSEVVKQRLAFEEIVTKTLKKEEPAADTAGQEEASVEKETMKQEDVT